MKKQQIISLTGTSLLAALLFGEGCCCPAPPIGEFFLVALIVDICDAIASIDFGALFLYVGLPVLGVIILLVIINLYFS